MNDNDHLGICQCFSKSVKSTKICTALFCIHAICWYPINVPLLSLLSLSIWHLYGSKGWGRLIYGNVLLYANYLSQSHKRSAGIITNVRDKFCFKNKNLIFSNERDQLGFKVFQLVCFILVINETVPVVFALKYLQKYMLIDLHSILVSIFAWFINEYLSPFQI